MTIAYTLGILLLKNKITKEEQMLKKIFIIGITLLFFANTATAGMLSNRAKIRKNTLTGQKKAATVAPKKKTTTAETTKSSWGWGEKTNQSNRYDTDR